MLLEAYFLIRKTFSKNMVSGGESDLKTVHVTVLASSILVLKDRLSSFLKLSDYSGHRLAHDIGCSVDAQSVLFSIKRP